MMNVVSVYSIWNKSSEGPLCIVRDSRNRRFKALFNMDTFEFEQANDYETEDLPKLRGQDAEDTTGTEGMWISVDDFRRNVAPDKQDDIERTRLIYFLLALGFSLMLVGGGIVWTSTEFVLEERLGAFALCLFGGSGMFIPAWMLSKMKRHFFSIITAAFATLTTIISLAALFITWVYSLP